MQAGPQPLCLVTGGATGLGFELARAFVAARCDVVLTGEGEVDLDLAAEELNALAPGAHIRWLTADLSRSSGPAALHHKLRTLEHPVDIFVANTSVGAWGDFGRADSLDDELATAHINALSTLHLARLLARDMADQGAGLIVLASSCSTSGACPFDTLQAATHAFTMALAEGLRHDLAGSGVAVQSLCPEVDAAGPCLRLADPAALVAVARALYAQVAQTWLVRRVHDPDVERCLSQLMTPSAGRATA